MISTSTEIRIFTILPTGVTGVLDYIEWPQSRVLSHRSKSKMCN